MTSAGRRLTTSLVICAYTPERWDDLVAAVRSAERERPDELIVVIDHHAGLLAHAATQFPQHTVLASAGPRGLSGARNTGLARASGDITVFLDDDAQARAGWLAALLRPYADPRVLGVGGLIVPRWDGAPPAWFPPEFLWVVGCSYAGLPTRPGPVRNLIGANMSGRTAILREAGGFRADLGRVGRIPLGGEETELCLRASERHPGGLWWHTPEAVVDHRVSRERATGRYLLRRCFAEGLSKAQIAALRGPAPALSAERQHLLRLPLAALRALLGAARGERAGLARAGSIVAGVGAAGAGYLWGRLLAARGNRLAARHGQTAPASAHLPPPTWIAEVALDDPLPALRPPRTPEGAAYGRARLTVKLHGQVLGMAWLELPPSGLSPAELARGLWAALAPEITAHLRADGQTVLADLPTAGLGHPEGSACTAAWRALASHAPPISVVVATRARPERLGALLDNLLKLDYPRYEVVIVDNAPVDDRTRALVQGRAEQDSRVRYVCEPRPGLSAARNAGVRHARFDLLAITDDDVTPDPRWLQELALGFGDGPGVGCVTGGILARQLDTPAQAWTEEYGGYHKGFGPQLYDLREHRRSDVLYPYAAGRFGSGANIALRRETWQAVGGFDEALGAGTPGLGGEDLALFTDVLFAGFQLAYRPGALILHEHHRDPAALRRLMYSYGAGLGAYVTRLALRHPGRLPALLLRLPAGLKHALSAHSEKNRGKGASFPPELTALERRGLLHGPLAYLRGVRARQRGQR